MPEVANAALALIEDPTARANQIADVVARDGALAGQVLRIANSAMFARLGQIGSIPQAITVLGLRTLRSIVMAAALCRFRDHKNHQAALVWENSVGTACAATLIAGQSKLKNRDEAYLLGLLHNIGQLLLISQAPAEYARVFDEVEIGEVDYTTAEKSVLGFTHTALGALVARKWNFPKDLTQAILTYKDPLSSSTQFFTPDTRVAVLQLADAVTHQAGLGQPVGYPDESEIILGAARFLELDKKPDFMGSLVEGVRASFDNTRAIYN